MHCAAASPVGEVPNKVIPLLQKDLRAAESLLTSVAVAPVARWGENLPAASCNERCDKGCPSRWLHDCSEPVKKPRNCSSHTNSSSAIPVGASGTPTSLIRSHPIQPAGRCLATPEHALDNPTRADAPVGRHRRIQLLIQTLSRCLTGKSHKEHWGLVGDVPSNERHLPSSFCGPRRCPQWFAVVAIAI